MNNGARTVGDRITSLTIIIMSHILEFGVSLQKQKAIFDIF